MEPTDPTYNPYAHNGPSTPLSRVVTVLAVIFAALLAFWYAWQGWSMAQQDCQARANPDDDIVATLSLTWTPPFTQCVVTSPTRAV
ncbi:hypothetical protein [Jonesia denitrificans]|jgi:hypothetical protein|uniref:Uncharacterized protein n=1 Tax=Jonesia denitrificans (strain ATCC 14870 / DSM 20603 / BCRC 15368 / CIP 55.134 / JCM 11481 / NBRC 15587 / NCTC 10816 / Prevot 55134) TaxID=471856 RepID=C7R3Q9_JONDD|nr:hypothetical protein [Jonesia denitrificans]ACV08766.1 hypothetical protein Jden_1110 [Jonesia denitrificans DSM 20603]ASE09910.1 hypothetical protein CEP80_12835 [Jonesia denitrificans]QXB42248.1 hypothetical protein I6L70_06460 [Jonesia denitrificans]SQH20755.1 Uncharacterised protein [Jonesia denitrificans]